jgi:hypothetical protein
MVLVQENKKHEDGVATNGILLYMSGSIKIAELDCTNTDNALTSQNIDFSSRMFF